MKRRAAEPEAENHERWLVSYADFITLLFAFFVVMFASSQTDKAKAKQVSDSVSEALQKGGLSAAVREVLGGTIDERGKGNAMLRGPGGAQRAIKDSPPPPPQPARQAELVPSLKFLTKELDSEIRAGKVQLRLEGRGLVVSLRQAAFFPSGTDALDPSTYGILAKLAQVIQGVPNNVRLEGHTDSIPISSTRFRDNWALSAARSLAVMELLGDRFDVPRSRMSVAGYGDTMPVDSNDTAEGRAHNRRVDLVLLSIETQVPQAPPVAQSTPPAGTAKK